MLQQLLFVKVRSRKEVHTIFRKSKPKPTIPPNSAMKSVAWYLVWLSPALAAWEFPRGPQVPLGGSHVWHADDVDIITGSQFNGLKTFGNLPYVNCFSDEQAAIKGNGYDIAVMGAPFDTVGWQARID